VVLLGGWVEESHRSGAPTRATVRVRRPMTGR